MKKILVSLMLLVMTALSAHAQFETEVWYVNDSLTGLDLSHSKNEGTNFGFALTEMCIRDRDKVYNYYLLWHDFLQ